MSGDRRAREKTRRTLESRARAGDVLAITRLEHERAERLMRRGRAAQIASVANRPIVYELDRVPLVPSALVDDAAVLVDLPRLRDVRPMVRPLR